MRTTCPVHHRLVFLNQENPGPVCDECAAEAAVALDKIESGVAAANFWATTTLERINGKRSAA